MEEKLTVLVVVLGLLMVLLLHYVGNRTSGYLRKRRAKLTQARSHFVKSASLLGQARSGKLTASEARSLAGSAIKEADMAIELDPNDAAILIVKSLALDHLGKSAAALKVLNAALSTGLMKSLSAQERADTLARRAELTLGQAKGKWDPRIMDALADLQNSVTLAPLNPRTHFMLGSCYERHGDKDEALVAFQQVLVLNPSCTDAKAALERLQRGGRQRTSVAATV